MLAAWAVFTSSCLTADECRFGPLTNSAPQQFARIGIGATPDPGRLAAWDIDVQPSGAGLPDGVGVVARGATLYQAQCLACHGQSGAGGVNDVLASRLPVDHLERGTPKAIGNYWAHGTTVFDYVRRSMPFNAPGSLTDQQVWDLTAYLLHLNDLLDADQPLDKMTLVGMRMPAAERYSRYDECVREEP